MYNGYRLKIDNVVFPHTWISKGSYSISEDSRVIETWVDANAIEHEETAPTKKTTITFAIREHSTGEHSSVLSFLQNDEVEVEYYSDRYDVYKTGAFRVKDIKWQHRNIGDGIDYDVTQITLIEN